MRVSIREIREGQRQQMKEESNFLSTSSLASDISETSLSTSSLKLKNDADKSDFELSVESVGGIGLEEHHLSPLPNSLRDLNPVRLSAGPGDLEPPEHLQKQTDDQVLADFFGTEQLGKLNDLKKGFSVEAEEGPAKSAGSSRDASTREGITSNGEGGLTSPVTSTQGPSVDTKPLGGAVKPDEPVSDMVSEMQKLRLRLQEETRQELAAIDRQYSPKLFSRQVPRIGHGRQGSVDIGVMRRSHLYSVEGSSLPQHSRDGSLDSSIPKPETLLEASFEASLVHTSGSHTRQFSLPAENKAGKNPSLPSEFQQGRHASRSPSPRLTSPGGTHYDSFSLERTRNPSRSPTPPYVGGHIRQGSVGSSTSGVSSPPHHALPSTVTTSYQQQPANQARGGPDRKPYSTPPPSRVTRAPQYPAPLHQNIRQSAVASSAKPPSGAGFPRVSSGGTPSFGNQGNLQQQHPRSVGAGGVSVGGQGYVQQQQRKNSSNQPPSMVTVGINRSASETYGSLDTKQPSRKPITTVRNGMASVPRSHGSTVNGPHYSTAVIRGKKHKVLHSRSTGEMPLPPGGVQYDHLMGSAGQSASQHPAYDRLGPQLTNPSYELDQPEQKSIPRGTHWHQPGGNPPRGPLPNPPTRNGSVTSSSYNGTPVYPEAIEPYMTSAMVKQQMQPFNYTPYADTSKGSSSNASVSRHAYGHRPGEKRRVSGNYDISEQTWC